MVVNSAGYDGDDEQLDGEQEMFRFHDFPRILVSFAFYNFGSIRAVNIASIAAAQHSLDCDEIGFIGESLCAMQKSHLGHATAIHIRH